MTPSPTPGQQDEIVERELMPCPMCNGDGWFDGSPIPTPQGPHYPAPTRCSACEGRGEIEVEHE